MAKIFPFEQLTKVNDKIVLDENDNLNSARALTSQFIKSNPQLNWKIKVVKDLYSGNYIIIRVK